MSAKLQTIEPEPLTPEIVPSEVAFPLTAERKELFRDALISTGGNISKACRLMGMTRQNVLRWRQSDAAFNELFTDALEEGTENLEESMYNRACKTDTIAGIFLLKARRPEKYRENIKVETELSDDAVDRITSGFIERLMELRTAQVTDGPDGPTNDDGSSSSG